MRTAITPNNINTSLQNRSKKVGGEWINQRIILSQFSIDAYIVFICKDIGDGDYMFY